MEQTKYIDLIRHIETKQALYGIAYDTRQREALANYGYELFLYSFEQTKREEQGT